MGAYLKRLFPQSGEQQAGILRDQERHVDQYLTYQVDICLYPVS